SAAPKLPALVIRKHGPATVPFDTTWFLRITLRQDPRPSVICSAPLSWTMFPSITPSDEKSMSIPLREHAQTWLRSSLQPWLPVGRLGLPVPLIWIPAAPTLVLGVPSAP